MRRAVVVLVAALALVACGPTPADTAGAEPVEVTVFAAASLRHVLDQAVTAYEGHVPGVTLTLSTDSSAALAAQIREGAPADVFLSADTRNPQALVDAGLVAGDIVVFAGNVLTIIVPADDPAGIASPFDLARPGVTIIAAGDEVPITRYATELVATLAAQPDAPADFADGYAANVVSKEDDVAAIVSKIELGEGDAAIVYRTDAVSSDAVLTVEVPEAARIPATYGGVVIAGSREAEAAAALLAWLASPDGEAILVEYGFEPAP